MIRVDLLPGGLVFCYNIMRHCIKWKQRNTRCYDCPMGKQSKINFGRE